MFQKLEKLGLSDSPEMLTMRLSDSSEKPVRTIDNLMLSEIVKTQKFSNNLQDVLEEQNSKISNIEQIVKKLADSHNNAIEAKEKENLTLKESGQVVLTLHGTTIKSAAVEALGATIERPISNYLNGFYSPISSGTYGVFLGLVAMGLTYTQRTKKGGSYAQWVANGVFIGGVSQMVQDIFTFVSKTYNIL